MNVIDHAVWALFLRWSAWATTIRIELYDADEMRP